MPIYTYKCEECGKEVGVIRSVNDMETPPTKEEQECKCDKPKWRRVMCAVTFKRLYSGSKGNW